MRRFAQQLSADLAPLWVGGLAVLQIYLLSRTLPLEGEPYEWAQYLLLGTVFPLLVLLLRLSPLFQALLAFACFLPVTLLIGRGWPLCLLIGTMQFLLLVALLRLKAASKGSPAAFPAHLSGVVMGIALTFLSWLVVSRWVWWAEFPEWLTASPYMLSIAIGAILLTTATVAGLWTSPERVPRRFGLWTNIPALAVFALLSTHIHGLGMRDVSGGDFGRITFHHWGAIVESSDLVRQGAWPLWDVPTQYGFLNTLLLAVLPFQSVWQSLYTCNAVLLTLSAWIVFCLLRSLRPGPIHYLFALLATVAAVFLLPGDTPELTGPFPYPSVGAYRFFWCYVILGVLARDYDSQGNGPRTCGRTLWLGCLAWSAGVLWSAESAVYCTTLWIPAHVLLALRQGFVLSPGPGRWRKRLPGLAFWLLLPPLLLSAAVAVICGVYLLGLGHLPDGRCFVEYCLALQFFALPINPSGAVGVLLLAYIVLATTGAYCLRAPAPLEHLPLVVGAAAALWAVSSYFVGRSHDNNVTNLTPLVVVALAAALRVLDRAGPNEGWSAWIKVSLLPVFTVLLVMPFFNPAPLMQYVQDTSAGYCKDLTGLLPDGDPALQQLLTEAEARADTPIAFFDNHAFPAMCPRWHANGTLETMASTKAWLPACSTVLYTPLEVERRHLYFSRFIARTRRSGFLIRPNTEPRPELAWVLEEVAKTHTPGRTLFNAQWTMTWFEYRSND